MTKKPQVVVVCMDIAKGLLEGTRKRITELGINIEDVTVTNYASLRGMISVNTGFTKVFLESPESVTDIHKAQEMYPDAEIVIVPNADNFEEMRSMLTMAALGPE